MKYRQLGRSGLRVSELGLGGSTFGRQCDAEHTRVVVHRALDLGVNFIDTADTYAQGLSESYVGAALSGRRHEAIIATKVGSRSGERFNESGLSRQHILEAIHGSLTRLRTDYIDLYQLHTPDGSTPLDETLAVMDELVRQGKVRYVGCSNFPAWQVCAALWEADRRSRSPLVSVQPRYNLLERDVEKELVPFCRAFGVGVIPYGPLASGILTGKYRFGEPPPPGSRFAGAPQLQNQLTTGRLQRVERLRAWAREHGRTVGQLAIAWLLSRKEVSTVITGVVSTDQLEDNLAGAEWKLTSPEVDQVEGI